MLIWFISNRLSLRLVLNVSDQEKNTVVFMAGFLSSNGRISACFDNIRLKVPTHAYFWCFPCVSNINGCGHDIEILKICFYDVITN